MEMQRAQRGLAPRGAPLRVRLRGHFPEPHDQQRAQPRHRLARDARYGLAGPQGRIRALARAGKLRRRGTAANKPARIERGGLSVASTWTTAACPVTPLRL